MSLETDYENIFILLKQKELLKILERFMKLLDENKEDETKTFTVKELIELVHNTSKEVFDEFTFLVDTKKRRRN